MENVSKALMIAGGVLIAILVTTLLLSGLTKLRQYQNAQEKAKKNEQISEFNSQFESYNKQVITGYELVSIGHLAEDTNSRYISDEGYIPVSVWVKPKNGGTSVLGQFIRLNGSVSEKMIGKTKPEQDGSYYNLIDFTHYFDNLSDKVQIDYEFKKTFKEAYFKCDKIEYDDRSKNASGRVIKMKFSEMTKKNT